MYGKPTLDATPTTGGGGTSGGTGDDGGGKGGGGTQKPTDPTDNAPDPTAPPVFNAPAAPNTIPESTYTNMTPQQKAAVISRTGAIDAVGRSGMGASAPKDQNKQVTSPVTKKPVVNPQNKQVTSPVTKKPVVTPPKKLKPVGAWDR
jgi:hypothetical protein